MPLETSNRNRYRLRWSKLEYGQVHSDVGIYTLSLGIHGKTGERVKFYELIGHYDHMYSLLHTIEHTHSSIS